MDASRPPSEGPGPATGDGGKHGADLPTRPTLAAEPLLSVPPEVLTRYNARVLDPATAAKVADQPPPRPTVYLADRLIVSGSADGQIREEIVTAAAERSLRLVPPVASAQRRDAFVALAREVGHADADDRFSTTHQLQPIAGTAVVADAWGSCRPFGRAEPLMPTLLSTSG
jgi:hypothetical protein